jgi:menaquinone-9 beta-reductase
MAIDQIYDVAVVGAGPAGAATATYLARAGRHVVVVDRGVFPRDKPCAEYLSPAAEPILRELGAMERFDATRISRLRGFRLHAPNGRVFQGDFAATRDAQGQSIFESGMVIPRFKLDAALVDVAGKAGAEIRQGWRLAQITREPSTGIWRLTPAMGDGDIRARLVVAADGVHSTVARRMGLHVTSRMRKIALVAHIRGIASLGEYGEMHVAHRRYVGLARLEPPEIGDLCNVAMVVDEGRDGAKISGHPQEFLLAALETFPNLRGRLASATVERRTLTISRICVRARQLSGDGLLLVGDAAGYYDPFTGEGIFHALRSAQLAAGVALPALATNDLNAAMLAQYDRLHHEEMRGKRAVEAIIQSAVQVPPLMNHIATVLDRRKWMADAVIAVTGDFLSPWHVLRPGYLLRLLG